MCAPFAHASRPVIEARPLPAAASASATGPRRRAKSRAGSRCRRPRARARAVVARAAAAAERRALAEEPEQRGAAAARAVDRGAAQRVGRREHDVARLRAQPARVELGPVLGEVGVGDDELARRGQPVAARAADLLVVLLDRLGRAPVHDVADVGLVDAHAERDRRDDDRELADEERAVRLLALGRGQRAVVFPRARARPRRRGAARARRAPPRRARSSRSTRSSTRRAAARARARTSGASARRRARRAA